MRGSSRETNSVTETETSSVTETETSSRGTNSGNSGNSKSLEKLGKEFIKGQVKMEKTRKKLWGMQEKLATGSQ